MNIKVNFHFQSELVDFRVNMHISVVVVHVKVRLLVMSAAREFVYIG